MNRDKLIQRASPTVKIKIWILIYETLDWGHLWNKASLKGGELIEAHVIFFYCFIFDFYNVQLF